MLEIGRRKAVVHFHNISIIVVVLGVVVWFEVKLLNCEAMQKLVFN